MDKAHCTENCLYLEFFWSVISCIRTEYGDLRSKSLCSVEMPENTRWKKSKYGHFLCCGFYLVPI